MDMSEASNMFADGDAYERMMGRWSRVAGASFIDWLKAPDQLRWLDAGCGNGAFTEELIARCRPAAVEGIDPSAEQISFASKRPGTRLAHFQQGDAQALPFTDNSFDMAVMALVIAFVPDPAKAVAELARVTKPGGLVAASMWGLPEGVPRFPLHLALRALGIEPAQPPSPEASKRDTMAALWRNAGLADVETDIIRIEVSHDNFDAFCASNLVPIGPLAKILANLTPPQQEKLRQHLQEHLPTSADGRITYEAAATPANRLATHQKLSPATPRPRSRAHHHSVQKTSLASCLLSPSENPITFQPILDKPHPAA
jgi:ubiquinone/menaquinone biosynthesis C-methylase UbiE